MSLTRRITNALYGANRLHKSRDDGATTSLPLRLATGSRGLQNTSDDCTRNRFASPLLLLHCLGVNGDDASSFSTPTSENDTIPTDQAFSKNKTHGQIIMVVPPVSYSEAVARKTTSTALASHIINIAIQNHLAEIKTPREPSTNSNMILKDAGIPRTPNSPSPAATFFSICYLVILMGILIGYICFTAFILAREHIKGKEERRARAARATQAATKVAGCRESASSTMRKAEPRLIRSSSRRTSRPLSRKIPVVSGQLAGVDGEMIGSDKSYEMDDLGLSKSRWSDDTYGMSDSRSIKSLEAMEASQRAHETRLRHDSQGEETEIGSWEGLDAPIIDALDEDTRVAALQRIRDSQIPTQTNLGDQNEWPVSWSRQERSSSRR